MSGTGTHTVPGRPAQPSGSLQHVVARNTLYNLATQGLMILMALWAIPHIVAGLTRDGFGLLSIIWAFVGYLALLDFGISRANTKFLAEAVAAGNTAEIRRLTWLSLWITGGIGAVSGIILYLATPWLVDEILKITGPYRPAALATFRFAAYSVPLLLLSSALRGFQMAMQRFDLVNIFQLAQAVAQWAGAVLLVHQGYGLEQVVMVTLGARMVLAVAALAYMPLLVPGFFSHISLWERSLVRKIVIFGGWVTISQIIGPVLLYLDRLFIGRMISLEAVTLYAVPQEALTRVLFVPVSLTATLFPAFSEQFLQSPDSSKAGDLYYRSLKYLLAVMIPVIFLLVVHAETILTLWMGEEFARQASGVFRVLACGLLFNALAQIPVALLHARGKPRLTALFHLAELPLMVLLNLFLIPLWGIMGAAISWMVRVLVDAVLLLAGADRQLRAYHAGGTAPAAAGMVWRFGIQAIAVFSAIAFLVPALQSMVLKIILTAAVLLIYAVMTWRYGFDGIDRQFFLQRAKLLGARA